VVWYLCIEGRTGIVLGFNKNYSASPILPGAKGLFCLSGVELLDFTGDKDSILHKEIYYYLLW
jgi:hypothetical protein